MRDEIRNKTEDTYRILRTLQLNDFKIHLKIMQSGIEIFQNGKIVDLSYEKLTLILDERMEGIKPILLEDIIPGSVAVMREIK